jgi:hypothetical protein
MSDTPKKPYAPFWDDRAETKRMVAEEMAKTREKSWKEVARQIKQENQKIREMLEEGK